MTWIFLKNLNKLFYLFFLIFIVIQLQLYAFSPLPSPQPQLNPPPSPTPTIPPDFVHVSFIIVPAIPSSHCPHPTKLFYIISFNLYFPKLFLMIKFRLNFLEGITDIVFFMAHDIRRQPFLFWLWQVWSPVTVLSTRFLYHNVHFSLCY